MDNLVQLPPAERRVVFEDTAAARNMQPQIVEKDFWVCWTLKELFQLPVIGEHLIFKGGTSLSKVFKVIERFSEDIDVSINRGFLGFGGANEPEAGTGNKEKRRRIEALKIACQQKISGELRLALETVFKAKLRSGERWSLRPDATDPDQQTLLFDYPSALSAPTGYVRQTVKIEMGARADHWPCETRTVTPFVAEEFPQGFHQPNAAVKVLSAERTFWEKATILHAEFPPAGRQGDAGALFEALLRFLRVDPTGSGGSGHGAVGPAGAGGRAQEPVFQNVLGAAWRGGQGHVAGGAAGVPVEGFARTLREDAADVLRRTA